MLHFAFCECKGRKKYLVGQIFLLFRENILSLQTNIPILQNIILAYSRIDDALTVLYKYRRVLKFHHRTSV